MNPPNRRPDPVFAELDACGLNLQAVFDVHRLPEDLRGTLAADAQACYRQLVLIGNLGPGFWRHATANGLRGAHPLDAFTRTRVVAWLDRRFPGVPHEWLYPGERLVALQSLGRLAGWHQPSPFMVGVNTAWGSWFAYRAALLADTGLAPTEPFASTSPCERCRDRPCVDACPPRALRGGFDLAACSGWRLASGSSCRDRCLARLACPAGAKHRYGKAQIAYHYARSLATLAPQAPGPACAAD
ncbi:MAG: hypothetical protein AMXMBFR52_18910 [Burkholderiales bacterium]|jgi:hypothetical protein|nr:hypothetical protein [Burkholderiaceae bacterium]